MNLRTCMAGLALAALLAAPLQAQPARWQQQASYTMDIDFDAEKHRFSGTQRLVYTNHSPDTLTRVFYHLFFNAFQPGSMMDVRSRTISDPDPRVGDRIAKLSESEIGYLHVRSLQQQGKALQYEEVGTILEVRLANPILPGATATFEMAFDGQVPLQIRRSGRDNKEGIDYSMAQWYPKMCEYDYEGWHANPYIGREFHGVWGEFDVTIRMPEKYVVAATGTLQNPQEIGYGYEAPGKAVKRKPENGKLAWHFKASRVHDFVWAADPDYHHRTVQVPNGPLVRFFYQKGPQTAEWENLDKDVVSLFQIMDSTFGKYPYEVYSVIQGGDGGMEYPMATLITGHRPYSSLLGVIIHEAIHSWYQMLLGTNEAKHAWMDEGFTSFASEYVESVLEKREITPYEGYRGYLRLAVSPDAEPLTTHSDHYKTNRAYSLNAYSKGAIALYQLQYIMGRDAFFRAMRRYYYTWRFKHPDPNDFKRVMEKESGLELDWFFEHWVGTTNTIDYGIGSVADEDGKARVELRRVGAMPMPLDVLVGYRDGSRVLYHIPLRIMRGEKPQEFPAVPWQVLPDWPWVYPAYQLALDRPKADIDFIEIDPSYRMADVDLDNNSYPMPKSILFVPGN